jgi:hypothetical protein
LAINTGDGFFAEALLFAAFPAGASFAARIAVSMATWPYASVVAAATLVNTNATRIVAVPVLLQNVFIESLPAILKIVG